MNHGICAYVLTKLKWDKVAYEAPDLFMRPGQVVHASTGQYKEHARNVHYVNDHIMADSGGTIMHQAYASAMTKRSSCTVPGDFKQTRRLDSQAHCTLNACRAHVPHCRWHHNAGRVAATMDAAVRILAGACKLFVHTSTAIRLMTCVPMATT